MALAWWLWQIILWCGASSRERRAEAFSSHQNDHQRHPQGGGSPSPAPASPGSTVVRILSMNVNQCRPVVVMADFGSTGEASAQSSSWWRSSSTWTGRDQILALRAEILRLRPHIMCLQECPTRDWAATAFGSSFEGGGGDAEHSVARYSRYYNRNRGSRDKRRDRRRWWCHGSGLYQAGYVCVLVRRDSPLQPVGVVDLPSEIVPGAVMVLLSSSSAVADGAEPSARESRMPLMVYLASIHLKAYKGFEEVRRRQMQAIVQTYATSLRNQQKQAQSGAAATAAAAPPLPPLIVAGDANFRRREGFFAEHRLGMRDAWKALGCDPRHRWTFDTRVVPKKPTADRRDRQSSASCRPFFRRQHRETGQRGFTDRNDDREPPSVGSAFLGPAAFPFRARFDRAYYLNPSDHLRRLRRSAVERNHGIDGGARGGASTRERDGEAPAAASRSMTPLLVAEVRPRNMTLVADRPIRSPTANRYLSDHFGICVDFELTFCRALSENRQE